MIVRDLAIANHYVMREHTPYRLMEAAANGLFRHFEVGPGFGSARRAIPPAPFHEMQSAASRVYLEVSPRAIAFDGVAPFRNLPFEFHFGERSSLRQIHLHAVSRGLDVADVHQAGQSRGPETRDGSAASIQRQMIASPLVQPAWRHDPGVLAVEIALLRTRNRGLVPGMVLVHGIAQGIGFHKSFGVFPVIVIRTAQQNADVQIDIDQVRGDQLAIHDDAGRDKHLVAPVRHVLVGVVAMIGIVERAPAAQQDPPSSDFFVTRQSVVEEVEQIVVQRDDLLHELHILHQTNQIVGEELNRRNGPDSAWIKSRWMNMASFHQAEHFARHAAHLQSFPIELARKGIQRRHDVCNGAIAM